MTDLNDKKADELFTWAEKHSWEKEYPHAQTIAGYCAVAGELARRLKGTQQKSLLSTCTDYSSAYFSEKARADELRRMLDEQIQHTANALRDGEEVQQSLDSAQEYLIPCPWCGEKMDKRPSELQINHLIRCGDKHHSANDAEVAAKALEDFARLFTPKSLWLVKVILEKAAEYRAKAKRDTLLENPEVEK